jgi:hypothetical protein
MRQALRATTILATIGLAAAGTALPAAAQAPASGLQAGVGGDPAIFGPTSSVPGPTGLPGSIQFYFKGRLHTDFMFGGDSLDHGGGNKSQNIEFGEYARLYTGFAGTAANGMQFGAYVEIRQNGSAALGASTGTNSLIFRRETGYIKGDWGQFRFGQTDGASDLFLTGTFENFDDAGWNSSDLPNLFSSNAAIVWPFEDTSAYYGTSKVVYLSPRFSGFDFGLAYEPNQTGTGEAACASATLSGTGGGCQRLSTIAGPASAQYRRNMFDAVGRYTGSLGPVALTATLGTLTAGHVNNTSAPASDPTIVQTGITLAFGGFAVGGNFLTGNINGSFVPLPKGGRHETAWVAGASYATGPFILGAAVNATDYQGATGPGLGGRSELGVAAGSTFTWAPGVSTFLSMLYGHRHQVGYDFATGAAGTASNNTRAFGITLGNSFNW